MPFVIHLKMAFFNLIESLFVICKYYRNLSFFRADLLLHLSYLFESPYHISKRFLKSRGESAIYAYGETPLTTLEKMAKECSLFSHDIVYDLGCGRGRTTFWLSLEVGCTAYGIEMIPEFMEKALRIKKWNCCENVFFKTQDMLETNFSKATCIYLYGTMLSEETMSVLVEKFSQLKRGTKIVTVSEPLPAKAPFKLLKEFEGKFPWGKGDLYLHVIEPAGYPTPFQTAFSDSPH